MSLTVPSRRKKCILSSALHEALYYRPGPSEPLSLGPGAYVAALEAASRREAKDTIVCGKPSAAFFQTCLDEMAASPQGDGQGAKTTDDSEEERNIVIGDDVEADLGGGAIEMGLERVLGEILASSSSIFATKSAHVCLLLHHPSGSSLCSQDRQVQKGRRRPGSRSRHHL